MSKLEKDKHYLTVIGNTLSICLSLSLSRSLQLITTVGEVKLSCMAWLIKNVPITRVNAYNHT